MPKTKIVCTIGPSSESPEVLRKLIQRGMNVARLNFSHGTHEEHLEKISAIREISMELTKPVAILQDLCGPKIRVGEIPGDGIRVLPGHEFILTSEPMIGTHERVSVSYPQLPNEVKEADRILLADGMMELVVVRIAPPDIYCRVINGGILTSHKGVNLPTGSLKIAALTDKDKDDLAFGLENGVDYIGLSFVRDAEDIKDVKSIISKAGHDTPVIAKIEKHEALNHIDAIIDASDGLMVARGDLGVEIPLENVPATQKDLVRKANLKGKPVIIATQMLRSMVDAPRPTRAEATDIANGVLDGADAIMLSEETASGKYPVEALQFMVRIAESAERTYPHGKYLNMMKTDGITASVAYAACILAEDLDAKAIVATTRSGVTAERIACFRPRPAIIALSPQMATIRRLALYWGCTPFYLAISKDTDKMIEKAADSALNTGMVGKGNLAVITAGRPIWHTGTTNMLWVKQL